MCIAIGIHVFDYGQKKLADQMRNTWERLVNHSGTIHEHDISNELLNKKTVIIIKLDHTQDSLDEHQLDTKRRDQSYQRLVKARNFQKEVFKDQCIVGKPTIAAKSKMSLAILNNEIVEAKYKSQHILPIVLDGDVKVEHYNEWQTYRERKSKL